MKIKPGTRIRIRKGFYRGQWGTVMSTELFGLLYAVLFDELVDGYAITRLIWSWYIDRPLRRRNNLIIAKHRFR